MTEKDIENNLINKLQKLGYTYRPDIKTYEKLTQNFREKFQNLNNIQLTDKEFSRFLNTIITPNIFKFDLDKWQSIN